MAKPKPSAAPVPSGSSVPPLAPDTLRRYAAGELSSAEQRAVEERLLNSQLHADAADGFEAAGAPTAAAAQTDLLARLQQRVNEPPAEPVAPAAATETTAVPQLATSAQRKRRWMIIGGVLIGFAALGGGLLLRYDRYVDEEAMAAKTRRAANYKGEDSEPKGFFASLFSDDEPTPEEIAAKRQADSLQLVARAVEVERLRTLEEQRRQERDDARREREAAAAAATVAAAPVAAPRAERPAEPTMRRMRGQVTTDAGVAIANAVVTIRATGRKVAAGADGWFNLELPTGSDPTLDVEAPGFVTRTARANGDGQVNVRLSTAEAVAVQSMASAVAAEKRIRTVRPEPEGGYGGYYRYLASAASLPDEAKRQKINGQVQVEFQVNPNGSLSDFRVVQGLGFGCDEEAVRVIQDGPKWTPGKANGEPVIKKVSMPVPFGK